MADSPGARSGTEQDDSQGPAKRRRRNTTRACDLCRTRKTKCDGFIPCGRCSSQSLTCSYKGPYNRGLGPPTVPSRPSMAGGSDSQDGLPDAPLNAATSNGGQLVLSRDDTPEVEEEGVEGLLGSSSNMAFSNAARLQLRSRTPSPLRADDVPETVGSNVQPNGVRPKGNRRSNLYFREDPFPDLDLARYSLPTIDRGLEMSKWYFDNASPTYRFLHRASTDSMVQQLCASAEWLGGETESQPFPQGGEALVLMVWAVGCQFPMLSSNRRPFTKRELDWLEGRSTSYYLVAQSLLEKDQRRIDRLSTVQVKLLMCIYLLSTSRLKAAWDLFAQVKHMANNLDLFKPYTMPAGQGDAARHVKTQARNELHAESRVRTFWAIYTLDTYLATMLGKTVTFDDRDIRIGYPSVADNVSHEHHADDVERPTLMWGLVAHARLARIIRMALRNLYHEADLGRQTDMIDQLSAELHQWFEELPEFLKMKSNGSLLPIFARQSEVIKLAQHHATILVYRPLLPLTSLGGGHVAATDVPPKVLAYQDQCLEAALKIIGLLEPGILREAIRGSFWFSAYVNFCAATVLLVYMAHRPDSPRVGEVWDAVDKSCTLEKKLMGSNRLARRYVAAIEALSAQVKRRFGSSRHIAPLQLPSGQQLSQNEPGAERNYTSNVSGVQMNMTTPVTWLSEDWQASALSPEALEGLLGADYSFDQFLAGAGGYDNTSFFDLESIVTTGMNFGNMGFQ